MEAHLLDKEETKEMRDKIKHTYHKSVVDVNDEVHLLVSNWERMVVEALLATAPIPPKPLFS